MKMFAPEDIRGYLRVFEDKLPIKSIQSALVIQPPPVFTEDKSSSLLGNEVGETIAGVKSFRNARQYELNA